MDIIKRRENKQKLSLLLYREPPETSGAKDKEKGRPLAQKERGKAPPPGAQRSVFSKTRVVFKKISHPCPAVTKKNAVFVVFTTELHGGPHSSAGAGPPPLCSGGGGGGGIWLFFHPMAHSPLMLLSPRRFTNFGWALSPRMDMAPRPRAQGG